LRGQETLPIVRRQRLRRVNGEAGRGTELAAAVETIAHWTRMRRMNNALPYHRRCTGQPRCMRALLTIGALLSLAGCASLPENIDRPVSTAFEDADDTRLALASRQTIDTHGHADSGESGFLLLGSGPDAFAARAALARAAERSIDAQYYLLHNDLTGKLFVDQLIRAADRGVRVRLLVDDMDLGGRTLGAAVLDHHPHIEVRLFNPFIRNSSRLTQLVTGFGSVTRRMHNKSYTVDNQVAILGGRNIGDEYFGADPELDFTDVDVLLVGPIVKEVSDSFDDYWNSELAYPATALLGRTPSVEEYQQKRGQLDTFVAGQKDSAYLQALRGSGLAHALGADRLALDWGPARLVHDQPEKIQADRSRTAYHMAPQLRPYFLDVERELYIFSPYFVPGRSGVALLSDLAARGVRVRVVTNSLASTDVPVVHSGYAKYRKALLRAGVELYEMTSRPGVSKRQSRPPRHASAVSSLHSKAFLFDRRHLFIGSLNLDPRSIRENTEIGVVLTSPALVERMAPSLDEAVERAAYRLSLDRTPDGQERIVWHGPDGGPTYQADPDTTLWERLWIGVAGLLPLESQL
jgi:putative cardiolipin synthase